MNARDELAYVIVQHPWLDPELFGVANWPKGYCPTCGKIIEAGHNSPAHAEHIAAAVLAAGYRKPRTITTAEELDALPDGSVILATFSEAMQKSQGLWWTGGERLAIIPELPAMVLHEGDSK